MTLNDMRKNESDWYKSDEAELLRNKVPEVPYNKKLWIAFIGICVLLVLILSMI